MRIFTLKSEISILHQLFSLSQRNTIALFISPEPWHLCTVISNFISGVLPENYPISTFSLSEPLPRKTDWFWPHLTLHQHSHNGSQMRIPGELLLHQKFLQFLEISVSGSLLIRCWAVTREVETFIHDRELFIEPRDSSEAGALLSRFMDLPSKGEKGSIIRGVWREIFRRTRLSWRTPHRCHGNRFTSCSVEPGPSDDHGITPVSMVKVNLLHTRFLR